MNEIMTYIKGAAFIFILSVCLASCSADDPFVSGDGQGTVRMNVDIKSRLTRADDSGDAYMNHLKETCRIYILERKNDKDNVMHKWTGVDNIQPVSMFYGTYYAEAYAGDSVPASFDDKYFKGRSEFILDAKNPNVQVSLLCKIANVGASVDQTSADELGLKDIKVTFSNAGGELEFVGETLFKQGYFMMPAGESTLDYTLTAVLEKGNVKIEKEGVIENVIPGHDYRLTFSGQGTATQEGGAFIQIKIEEGDLYEEDIVIKSAPQFAWMSSGLEIEDQIVASDMITDPEHPAFEDYKLRVGAFDGFSTLTLTSTDAGLTSLFDGTNLADKNNDAEPAAKNLAVAKLAALEAAGIECLFSVNKEQTQHACNITLGKSWLESLPVRSTEYVINVEAKDKQATPKTSRMQIRIANEKGAVEVKCLVEVDEVALAKQPMAVLSTTADLPVNIMNNFSGYAALRYRAQGSSEWILAKIGDGTGSGSSEEGATVKTTAVSLAGLTAGTVYEYQVVAGALKEDGDYESKTKISTFETEGIFSIPNASMEEWAKYVDNSKVWIPSADGTKSFWDTGNHGSATMNKNITNQSTTVFHTGLSSAELKSQFVGLGVVGKFAAGNIFAGQYLRTEGTDGVLSFGAPYNESHPSALSVWVKYTPGTVESNGANDQYLKSGAKDQGIVYIALVTDAVEIQTASNKLKLLKKDGKLSSEVLAYGEYVFTGEFNENGGMKKVTIPFKYDKRALAEKSARIVIVCSASLYGDFFCGGEGSLMYVDDFSLEYGDIQWEDLQYQQ